MPRFFVEGCPKGEVLLGGEDGRHIVRSLRMRPGEALTLCDGQGTDYACTFVSAQGESALVRVEEAFPNRTEPRAQVTVCPRGTSWRPSPRRRWSWGLWPFGRWRAPGAW